MSQEVMEALQISGRAMPPPSGDSKPTLFTYALRESGTWPMAGVASLLIKQCWVSDQIQYVSRESQQDSTVMTRFYDDT